MILLNSFISIFLTNIEFVNPDFWILLAYEILILGVILSLANRASDKILKGLQGTAATTIIARGVYDAYNKWKDDKSSSNGSNPENKIKTKLLKLIKKLKKYLY
jgi:hypothetical protein